MSKYPESPMKMRLEDLLPSAPVAKRKQPSSVIATYIVIVFTFSLRTLVVMFLAAVVYKRFGVFAPIGFIESMAWTAGLGLVKEIVTTRRIINADD